MDKKTSTNLKQSFTEVANSLKEVKTELESHKPGFFTSHSKAENYEKDVKLLGLLITEVEKNKVSLMTPEKVDNEAMRKNVVEIYNKVMDLRMDTLENRLPLNAKVADKIDSTLGNACSHLQGNALILEIDGIKNTKEKVQNKEQKQDMAM